MKILVVGGAGFIGSHCVRQLLAAGHETVILDSFVYGHRDSIPQGLTVYDGDMGDISFTQPILEKEKVDIVMHFAAFAYVGESTTDPLKYYENNIAKTVHLLQAMINTKVNTFIFSSSCTIFGDTNEMPIARGPPPPSLQSLWPNQAGCGSSPRILCQGLRIVLRLLPLLQCLRRGSRWKNR